MGTLKISDRSLKRYFGFLKNLDTKTKRKLIDQLTDSIEPAKPGCKIGIGSLYGAWEDDRTADEIINEIRKSRVDNRIIEDIE